MRCTGRVGECRFKTGVGEIRVEQGGSVQLTAGAGDITVERAGGDAELTTGSGVVQIGGIDGTAAIKNGKEDTWIGEVSGELRVNAANGKISVEEAQGAVSAKTANGDIRLGEVSRGAVLAQTAYGKLEVGIREGVAAWLDLNTHWGNVQHNLDATEHPGPSEDAVEVRARSGFGDITVRRAQRLTTTA